MVNETSKIKPGGSIRSNYSKLNQPYRSIVDYFMVQHCNEHLSFQSILKMTTMACSFFVYLQNRTYESLEDVSEEDVINIVEISVLLGHEQLATTMKYLDISTEDQMKGLATMDDENTTSVSRKWKKADGSLKSLLRR
jgi:hypothetical protein